MQSKIPTIINTLIGSGFHLQNLSSKPSYLLLRVYRRDEFGIAQPYVLAYSGDTVLKAPAIAGLHKVALNDDAPLVIIGAAESAPADVPVLTLEQFTGRMGGAVTSVLPLEAEYPTQLAELGLNKKPPGLRGRTDDLFEAYVHAGLQFILQGRVIRYGQDRLFEAVPDGVVLGRESIQLLYDCKAYKNGYPISRDSIRQFADYVRTFHGRYESYVGRLHSFLVVSGKFQSDSTLEARSRELYSECQVPLAFMTAETLGQVVTLLNNAPRYRQSIDWNVVLSSVIIKTKAVQAQLRARKKDKIIVS